MQARLKTYEELGGDIHVRQAYRDLIHQRQGEYSEMERVAFWLGHTLRELELSLQQFE